MATWYMFSFQDSNSPYADNLVSFHNLTMTVMVMIVTLIVFIIFEICINKHLNRYLLKNHFLETVWTIFPIFILIFICFPSLKILYYMDELLNPYFSVKVIGHQWYWSYEYPEFNNLEFDSYMISYSLIDQFRLLDVDNRVVVPSNLPIRLVLTSSDVIHSWAIQSLGIKVDAVPGRINQVNLYSNRSGLFFGQCSEICGMNHSFMPIVLESTTYSFFTNWINKF
uniref:Cytochrome c oxidase subunit 2 n=1 Tax=Habropoda radoszkowskii TaxID=597470 RepID=A0A7L8EYC7_9HYME|nr:cytochrome c oxidase subunit II [Habropoda radoszkowskii]QOE17519.1 cytochrome c oxidase subunit 2 [Habropoda radoszkowskii]